ncbi:uncharacterized protein LOC113643588 [Tachysurus fulvidraco]|uniref:uncharacterized protein LOC113643588 n=1 Tax=Tachysurus fulvidraco TaxID=1234273 RepID=UPI001FEDE02F|nr:uncharacterized protein LOC113643588 [Tachysurus fulvidraco]
MRRSQNETPQQQTILQIRGGKKDILSSKNAGMTITPELSSSAPHQQTEGPERDPAHSEDSPGTIEKENIHLSPIKTTRSTAPTKISGQVELAYAGLAAKNPEMLRFFKRSQRLDLNRFSSFRDMMRWEKKNEYKYSLDATEKENIHLSPINTTKTIPPLMILEEVEGADAVLRPKTPKTPRKQRMDTVGLSPFRGMRCEETTDDQKQFLNIMEPVTSIYMMNYSAKQKGVITFNFEKDVQNLKDNINSIRMSTYIQLYKESDQSSVPELKYEDEGILAAPESMHELAEPLTSKVKSDFVLATTVLEKTRPFDVTSQMIQMTGFQEYAWPVPSPPSGDKPNVP